MSTAPALRAFAGYGVELEYMIVDGASLDVRPIADELLRAVAGRDTTEVARGAMGWSNELARHQIEIKNPRPQPALEDLALAFEAEVEVVNALLDAYGARLMPGGMHPWMDPARETRLWEGEPAGIYRAYDRIFDCHRHGWANLQSMHLNLPFAGDREFAQLHAAVRLALPILPALAASSPYADGRWTGFLDYRLEIYRDHQMRLPATMGKLIPEVSASRADYEMQVLAPMYRELAEHPGAEVLRHEWLNARAAIPRFERNAIEIRLLDVQECPQADLAIAAAVLALVRRLYDTGPAWLATEAAMGTDALRRILDACRRDAEQALIEDTHYLAALGLPASACHARELWGRLLDAMTADSLLAPRWAAPLQLILERGPLARRLLDTLGSEPTAQALRTTYRELCQCLQEGQMYPGPARPTRPQP
jgi:glutamate---cysteine ligase / carboxylate-amine ligase